MGIAKGDIVLYLISRMSPFSFPLFRSPGDQQSQIPSLDRPLLRFTEHRTLKTEHPQPRCELRFPYAACRCNTTELLEQMP